MNEGKTRGRHRAEPVATSGHLHGRHRAESCGRRQPGSGGRPRTGNRWNTPAVSGGQRNSRRSLCACPGEVASAQSHGCRDTSRLSGGARTCYCNGSPGLIAQRADGSVDTAFVLDVADGVVVCINVIRNPDKLTHLAGPSVAP